MITTSIQYDNREHTKWIYASVCVLYNLPKGISHRVIWMLNSLWLNDVLCWYSSGLTLAHVIVCSTTAPSHYLTQSWFTIKGVLWHSPESTFKASARATTLNHGFQNYTFEISAISPRHWSINTLRLRQNGHNFPDNIFRWIFLNENVWISINISLKFVPRGPINNIPTLVKVMAWHRPGDKPLSEPMMARLPTHICVTRPQWDNIEKIINEEHHCCNNNEVTLTDINKTDQNQTTKKKFHIPLFLSVNFVPKCRIDNKSMLL